jgi:hypothetical protein
MRLQSKFDRREVSVHCSKQLPMQWLSSTRTEKLSC